MHLTSVPAAPAATRTQAGTIRTQRMYSTRSERHVHGNVVQTLAVGAWMLLAAGQTC
jgi:hypothetical protein